MSKKTGAKKIQKHLCVQYDIAFMDVELLMNDIAENVELLKRDIEKSLEAEDWHELNAVSQALHGLAKNVDVDDLKSMAEQVETAAKDKSKDLDEVVQKLSDLATALRPDLL